MTSSVREGDKLKAQIIDLRKKLDYMYNLLEKKDQYIESLHKLLEQDNVYWLNDFSRKDNIVSCHRGSVVGGTTSDTGYRNLEYPTENDCHLDVITSRTSRIATPKMTVKNKFTQDFNEFDVVEQFTHTFKKQAKLYCQRIDQLQRECCAKDFTINELCQKIDKCLIVLKPITQLFLEEHFYQSQQISLNKQKCVEKDVLNEFELAKLAELALEIAYKPLLFGKRSKRQGYSAEPINLSLIEECVGLIQIVPKTPK